MIRIQRTFLIFFLLASMPLIAAPRTVIVFDLNDLNNNPNFNYLAKSLPKSLIVSLKNTGGFQTMSHDNQTKKIDFKTAMSLAEQNKCDIAILGNFIVIGGNIQINLEAVDVKLKRVKIAESVSGKADKEIFDLVDEIVEKMSDRMIKDLPKEKESAKIQEKMSVEEVYFSGSRKDQWFFTSLGMMNISLDVQGDTPETSVSGSAIMPIVGLGYGFKSVRFFLYGQMPLFEKPEEDKQKAAFLENMFMVGVEWKIIKNRLFAYSEIDNLRERFIIQLTWIDPFTGPRTEFVDYILDSTFFTTGVRYTIYKGLSAVLKVGIPLSSKFQYWHDDQDSYQKARWAPLFYSGVIWKFPGSAGIKAEYFHYSTKNAEILDPARNGGMFNVSNNCVVVSFFYEMDF